MQTPPSPPEGTTVTPVADTRSIRYFIDDASGILVRFDPATGDGQFDYATGQWGPDEFQTASEHMMRGGYLTEITAEEAQSLGSTEAAFALLAAGPRPPFLPQ